MSSREDPSGIWSVAQLGQAKTSDVNSILDSFLEFSMLFSTQVNEGFMIELKIHCKFSANVSVVHERGSIESYPHVCIIEYIF